MRYMFFIVVFAIIAPTDVLALDGEFKTPPVGTRASYGDTTYTVNAVDGFLFVTKDSSGNKAVNFAHFTTYSLDRWQQGAFEISKDKLKRFWPLEIGKTVQYEISDNSGIWKGELRVQGKEEISTPAGTFDTFRVTRKRRVVSGPWSDKTTLWYAPEIRFIVKWQSKTTGGKNYGATNQGTLVSYTLPKNKSADNLTNTGNTEGSQGGKDLSGSIEDRLQKLKNLHEQGLISDEEYEKKKKSILQEL